MAGTKKETKAAREARIRKEKADAARIEATKKALIEEFAKPHHRGMVTPVCDAVGISRATFYNYQQDDADFAAEVEAAIEDARETRLDFVVGKMYEIIEAKGKGAGQLIIYELNTHGKSRGYGVDKGAGTGTGGAGGEDDPSTLTVNINFESSPMVEDDDGDIGWERFDFDTRFIGDLELLYKDDE